MQSRRGHVTPLSLFAIALSVIVVVLGGAQIARAADLNPDCTLVVPASPLTATGLATPYQLTATDPDAGACTETSSDQAAFVEAAILDPATGKLSIYHPVVVDKDTKPLAAPVVPTLPAGAVVALWFGSNGDTLRLTGPGAVGAVTGAYGSVFGQFSYLNARAFFAAANGAIRAGKLVVPPLGQAVDGKPCPTVRDWMVVDQDQSDNVGTAYWTNGTLVSQTEQTGAGWVKMPNGSDEGLLANRIDPALGCTPWLLPSVDQGNKLVPSLAANELSAATFQAAPAALVPLNDPMTLVDGHYSVRKTDRYRTGVDQAPLFAGQTPRQYCIDMVQLGAPRVLANEVALSAKPSPDAGVNLFDFLNARFANAMTELGCADLMKPAPHHHNRGHQHHDDD